MAGFKTAARLYHVAVFEPRTGTWSAASLPWRLLPCTPTTRGCRWRRRGSVEAPAPTQLALLIKPLEPCQGFLAHRSLKALAPTEKAVTEIDDLCGGNASSWARAAALRSSPALRRPALRCLAVVSNPDATRQRPGAASMVMVGVEF